MHYAVLIGVVGAVGTVGTAMATSKAYHIPAPEGEWTAIAVAMLTVTILLYLLNAERQDRRKTTRAIQEALISSARANSEVAAEMRELRRKNSGG